MRLQAIWNSLESWPPARHASRVVTKPVAHEFLIHQTGCLLSLNSSESPGWFEQLSPSAVWSLWGVLLLALSATYWFTGVPDYQLLEAVELGTAQVERRYSGTEESDEVIREAIQTQRDTLSFWTTLALLNDFVVVPLSPCLRSLAATIMLCSVAALFGRSIGFEGSLIENSLWQGVWVAGFATRIGLMFYLGEAAGETSAVLLLPPAEYDASKWVMWRELDFFALFGWIMIIWGSYRRGQANLVVATLVVSLVAGIEMMLHASFSLGFQLSMRLTLVPQ